MKSIVRSRQRRRSLETFINLKRGAHIPAIGSLLAVPLVALALGAPAHAQPLPLADQQFVDSTVASTMQATATPGVSISITGPGGDYAKAYGLGNAKTKTPLNLNDHFRIGSITKSMTATAILQQIEKGKLHLTDTIDKFVSGIPKGNLITIKDMLMMRSGVYDYQSSPLVQLTFTIFPTAPFSPGAAITLMRTHPSQFAPGTQYQYTNSNYVLLGEVLRKVTGQDPQVVITNDVIKPLGLTNTSFPKNSALPAPYTHGYVAGLLGGTKDETAINPALFGTAGAVVSTIGDMTKYGNAMMNGALLSPQTWAMRKQMFCPVPYTLGGPSQFGYGLGLISFGSWYGHDGSVPGFSTEVMFDPQSGTMITGMENKQTTNLTALSRTFEQIGAHLVPGSMNTPQYPSC